MPRPGFLVAIARADQSIREEFERWYHDEHLPLAAKLLRATQAMRLRGEGETHIAVYRLADLDALEETDPHSPVAELISDFNARWPTGVERRRFYVEILQELDLRI